MKTVLASGVFDILHPGHLYYLTEAKKFGDRLVVVVTADETAWGQGKQPIFSGQHRVELVSQLKMVDQAIVGRPGKQYEAILDVWPDIIAVGWDQGISASSLRANEVSVAISGIASSVMPPRNDINDDAGVENLRSELQKYHWSGQIVRIGKMPSYTISSSTIKDGIIHSTMNTFNF